MRSSQGDLIQKAWAAATTSRTLHLLLDGRLCSHIKGSHPVIQACETSRTALYPVKLCRLVVKIILGKGPGSSDAAAVMELLLQHQGDASADETCDVFGTIFAEDAISAEQTQQVRVYLRRVHANSGHPSNLCLQKMLRDAKAHPEVIRLAGEFECDLCKHRALPQPRLPAATIIHEPRKVNAWDCFYWTHPVSHRRSCSVIFADEGSRGYQVQVLKTGPLAGTLGSPS